MGTRPSFVRSHREQLCLTGGKFLLQLARDDNALDLIGAVPDLMNLRLAIESLDRKFLRISIAAKYLQRVGNIAHAHVAREKLCVRRFLGEGQSCIAPPRCIPNKNPVGISISGPIAADT